MHEGCADDRSSVKRARDGGSKRRVDVVKEVIESTIESSTFTVYLVSQQLVCFLGGERHA